MRMVRNFEHISGMLRQQSMLTKNDGNHERNKNVNVLKQGKDRKTRGKEREREIEEAPEEIICNTHHIAQI